MSESTPLHLHCHTDIKGVNDEYVLCKDKNYEVFDEDDNYYVVENEEGDHHFFTKEPDQMGKSYLDWFDSVKK
jgi:hypothetical protein